MDASLKQNTSLTLYLETKHTQQNAGQLIVLFRGQQQPNSTRILPKMPFILINYQSLVSEIVHCLRSGLKKEKL